MYSTNHIPIRPRLYAYLEPTSSATTCLAHFFKTPKRHHPKNVYTSSPSTDSVSISANITPSQQDHSPDVPADPRDPLPLSNPSSLSAPCSLAPAAPSHSPSVGAADDSANTALAFASVLGFAAANEDL